jgi:hypothetical protein
MGSEVSHASAAESNNIGTRFNKINISRTPDRGQGLIVEEHQSSNSQRDAVAYMEYIEDECVRGADQGGPLGPDSKSQRKDKALAYEWVAYDQVRRSLVIEGKPTLCVGVCSRRLSNNNSENRSINVCYYDVECLSYINAMPVKRGVISYIEHEEFKIPFVIAQCPSKKHSDGVMSKYRSYEEDSRRKNKQPSRNNIYGQGGVVSAKGMSNRAKLRLAEECMYNER